MKKPHKYPKQDNPKAKAAELQRSWDALLAKHSKPLFGKPTKAVKLTAKKPVEAVREVQNRIPSNPNSMMGIAAKAPAKVYTGTKIVGIATMHKSNLVPIFNTEAAVEVAQMRRN
jgi:hypothetical protein